MDLRVDRQGVIQFLYDETIDLSGVGRLFIRRASHVEPDSSGQWFADLATVGGPRLGPYSCRSAALAAEASWLHAQHLFANR